MSNTQSDTGHYSQSGRGISVAVPVNSSSLRLGARLMLPLASTAMAMSLIACGVKPAREPVVDTHTQAAVDQVQSFTNGMDGALDSMEIARMKAAMAGQPLPRMAKAPATQPMATTMPQAVKPMVTMATTTQPAAEAVSEAVSEPLVPAILATMKSFAFEPPAALVLASRPAKGAAVQMTSVRPMAPAEPTYDAALKVVRKTVAGHPTLNTVLALALLDGAAGKSPDTAVAAGLSAPDQKLFTDLLAALQGMTVPVSNDITLNDRAAPLVDAARRWQSDGDLSLPKMALASRVDSFGVYTALEPKFTQGQRRTVIIYCEVANFTSKRADDGWFETRLSQQESLITEDGLLAWRPNAEEVEDRSRNQRHDFYLVKKMTIPETLAAGKYMLRMNVTDRTSNKIAMVSMPIEIIDQR